MEYGNIENFQTGVAIPVSGLKTKNSCAIGEFRDLIPFAQWVQSTGMDLIQLLPVNDTGEEPSPYSALSAFALNPVFIHLEELPCSEEVLAQVKEYAAQNNKLDHISYRETYRFKKQILHTIFSEDFKELSQSKELHQWIEENSWVKSYAVFYWLKEKNDLAGWMHWKTHNKPTPAKVDSLWAKNWDEVVFFAWIQFELEKQFRDTAKQVHALGVRIKGDIPILISEDSADVWANRKIFDLSMRAGAPPDMFCYSGQNWRFPTYKWDVLEKENYSWWRARLQQASKFYHAYRIDHVLGFFRIWQIPEAEHTGMIGRFAPALPLRRSALVEAGLPEGTIDYLINPVYSQQYMEETLAGLDFAWTDFFKQDQNAWRIDSEKFVSENSVIQSDLPQEQKDALLKVYWNRVLVQLDEDPDVLHPFWYWYDSQILGTLPENEQNILREAINQYNNSQEDFWAENGRKLLVMMREETDMLVCAEDLGVVPNCVPTTLRELRILSLKIERWSRDWDVEGAPWQDVQEYPRLSVCSPSCHDTSTLREYWEEEGWPREEYAQLIGLSEIPNYLTTEVAEAIVQRNLDANSLVVILPLQDWLSLSYDFRTELPHQEKINTPGTLNGENWSWRMLPFVEELQEAKVNAAIKTLVDARRARSVD